MGLFGMEYFQIANPSSYFELVQDSKFIGYCFLIYSDDEAEQCRADLARQHPKATHICWAYRLSCGSQLLFYTNDAGEPRGSAGQPILHALERRQLVNTWCGVVRYFGGTKLGIGGLIRAYGRVAGRTLDQAGVEPVERTVVFEARIAYAQVGQMYNFLKRSGWKYTEIPEKEGVIFTTAVPEKDVHEFCELVRAWGGLLVKK